jgi:rubrerythrin
MKTGSFETDTKRAEKRSREMAREIDKAFKMVGAAVLAAGAAFVAMTKSIMDSADSMAKASRSIGISTESLSALQYAAELSGVSANELNQSLLRLNKSAADGNKAFDAMGISVRDAQGNLKATDTLLKEVSDKFSSYADGAEKSALAQEIFGRSGAQMISLLNEGSEGLSRMEAEAQRLGIVISGDLAKNAEALNDNLSKIALAAKGAAIQIAGPLIKSLADLTNGMFEAHQQGSGFVDMLHHGFRRLSQAKTIEDARRQVNELEEAMHRMSVADFHDDLNTSFAKLQQNLDFARQRLHELLTEQSQESIKPLVALGTAPKGIAPIVGGGDAALAARKKIDEDYNKWILPYKEAEANRIYEIQAKRLRDEEIELQKTADWLMSHEQATQNRLYQIQAQRLAKEEEDAKGYWGRWLEGAENAMMSFDQLAGSVLDNFTKGFGNAFEKMVFDSKKLSDSFKSMAETMLRSIVNALGQMAAQWLTYKAVQMLVGKSTQASAAASQTFQAMAMQQMAALNAFASTAAIPVVGPIAAPAAAGAAFAATSPFVATVASLGAAAVGARATGGPVSADAPYLVGERGPELFVPNTAGKILTNQAISGGGQPMIQQNINVTTGVQQTVRAEIINMMPQIANAAKLAVSDARMRGGSFSSALR